MRTGLPETQVKRVIICHIGFISHTGKSEGYLIYKLVPTYIINSNKSHANDEQDIDLYKNLTLRNIYFIY